MNHSELINDLAETFDPFRNVVFKEPPLGSKWLNRGVPIPDLLVLRTSYTKPEIRLYEVKAHESDLKADCRENKWESYLPHCDRIYFALGPEIKNHDIIIHQPVGIIKRGKTGWKVVRPAPKNAHRQPLTEEICLALIFTRLNYVKESRLARLEAEKQVLLKEDIKELKNSSNLKFTMILRDIKNREERLKYSANDAKQNAISELRKHFGLIESGWNADSKSMVSEILLTPLFDVLHKNFDRLMEGLK